VYPYSTTTLTKRAFSAATVRLTPAAARIEGLHIEVTAPTVPQEAPLPDLITCTQCGGQEIRPTASGYKCQLCESEAITSFEAEHIASVLGFIVDTNDTRWRVLAHRKKPTKHGAEGPIMPPGGLVPRAMAIDPETGCFSVEHGMQDAWVHHIKEQTGLNLDRRALKGAFILDTDPRKPSSEPSTTATWW
jgi:hypothetical protein